MFETKEFQIVCTYKKVMRRPLIALFLSLLVFPTPKISAQALPVIDGNPDDKVWESVNTHSIPMQNQITIDLKMFFTNEMAYFLAIVPHDRPGDKIILDTTVPHDYFGIDFDNNNDKVLHGTEASPDDMVLVNYFRPGAQDFLTKSFQVINDTAVGGTDNVEGATREQSGKIIFEFSKEMNSGDRAGADISLKPGDSLHIMLAFWDDRPTRDANVYANKPQGGSIFLEFQIKEFAGPSTEIPTLLITITGLAAAVLATKKKFDFSE